jgi:hypothetical protein
MMAKSTARSIYSGSAGRAGTALRRYRRLSAADEWQFRWMLRAQKLGARSLGSVDP